MSLLPADLQEMMNEIGRMTQSNSSFILNIAIAYTGREEITSAIASAVSSRRGRQQHVSAEVLSRHLYTHPSSNPTLLIRTSGEVRLSDFMTWQTSAAYLHFTPTLWPEFGVWGMLGAILQYQRNYHHLTGLKELLDPTQTSETQVY